MKHSSKHLCATCNCQHPCVTSTQNLGAAVEAISAAYAAVRSEVQSEALPAKVNPGGLGLGVWNKYSIRFY